MRRSLAEELVVAAQAQEAGTAAAQEAAAARAQARALAERLVAAEELLGEREELLSELRQDLQDVKQVCAKPHPLLRPRVHRLHLDAEPERKLKMTQRHCCCIVEVSGGGERWRWR